MLPQRLLVSLLLAISSGDVWSSAFSSDQARPRLRWTEQSPLHLESPEPMNIPVNDGNGVPPGLHHDRTNTEILHQMMQALSVMQSDYFELWIGIWPTAIDWTAAVINTYLSATLETVDRESAVDESLSTRYLKPINKYFSQSTAYYFGEDAFSIRNEAYDDMLWVVLGWLESIKFVEKRNTTEGSWHGTQFIPAFAHRARVFWDIASKGWDTTLCGGGMIWNPSLTPYKNAITNQLFISASIAMYHHYPGDSIDSPFVVSGLTSSDSFPGRPYDPKYLTAAIDGYHWLKNSNMTNDLGLYVDGYHITGWGHGSIGTGKCDERNEMVYTYNQGVVLSGLRGLWEGTGNTTYLKDGYSLVVKVMAATGWIWSGDASSPIRKTSGRSSLGENGILEETCDRQGQCSQDAQTFKGIYFQHLSQFCAPLPPDAVVPGKTHGAGRRLRETHRSACRVIGEWALHNAVAALNTRDEQGRFGMWWGQGVSRGSALPVLPAGASDYRNNATVLSTEPWTSLEELRAPSPPQVKQRRAAGQSQRRPGVASTGEDANDRGRGRTVETQGGGLSVLRSAWELLS